MSAKGAGDGAGGGGANVSAPAGPGLREPAKAAPGEAPAQADGATAAVDAVHGGARADGGSIASAAAAAAESAAALSATVAAAGEPGAAGAPAEAAADGTGGAATTPSGDASSKRGDSTRPVPTEAPAPSGAGIYVRLHGQTDVGLVREHNEDNFLVADLSAGVRGVDERTAAHRIGPRGSIFAVCDGMGGAAAGEVASQMAVDTLHEVMSGGPPFTDHDDFARRLVRAIEEAGTRIFSAAKLDRSRRGMGTTSTVAGLVDRMLFVGQIGDSRAYVLRNGELGLITKDQSLVNQLIEAGQLTEEEAEAFEHSNIILQALGTAEQVTVDLTFLELRRGDRLMLCSDGLSGLVHADLIKDVLATVKEPRGACATLIEMARTGGGHDNITVIVVDFDGDELAPPDGAAKPSYQQYPLPAANDPRTTYPPREVGLKGSASKPGSDVKARPPAPQDEVPAPPSGGRTWVFFALVLLLALVGVAALALSGSDAARDGGGRPASGATDVDRGTGGGQGSAPSRGEGLAAPPPPLPQRVRVTTDVEGSVLWIDDEEVGPFEPAAGDGASGFARELNLLPGVHRLEVRGATGARVRDESVTVEEGGETTFALDAPRAPGPGPLPPSTAVVVEPAGTTRSSGSGARAEDDGDAGRPRRRRDAGAEGEPASGRSRSGEGAGGGQGIPANPF